MKVFYMLLTHILELQKEKGELTDKCRELEKELADAKKVQVIEHFEAYGQCRDSRRIAELEKENADLKSNNNIYCEGEGETLVVNVSFDKFTRINANHKMYYPYNEELEKENATLLKDRDRWMQVDKEDCDNWNKDKTQLTKAKELLERLLITSCNSDVLNLLPNCSEVLRVRMEAEQFLKEVEE